ncbi:MAG: transposase, partial [bacterium]
NRRWLKEKNIRITAPALGRKPKMPEQNYYQKRKARKEATERNHIEGKFGQGKNGYNLNKIRARLKATSESWIASIFFIMNLIHYEKKVFLYPFCKWCNRQLDKVVLFLIRITQITNFNTCEENEINLNLIKN